MRGKLKGLNKVNKLQDVTEVDESEDETQNQKKVKISLKKSSIIEKLDSQLKDIQFCELNLNEDDLPRSSLLLNKIITALDQSKNELDLSNLNLNNTVLKNIDFESEHFKLGLKNQEIDNLLCSTTTIRLSYNKLNSIAHDFLNLFPNLEVIKLDNNNIETICSTNFGSKLRILDLSYNSLSKIQQLDGLVNLEELNLASNKLQIDENTRIFQSMTSLRFINLSKNNLNSLDLSIFHQNRNLRQLILSHNPNISLTGFAKLYKLKLLDLSSNNFNNIPNEIKLLINLQYLYLDKNNLEFIPSELNELNNLEILSLNGNQIRELNDLFCLNTKFKFSLRELNLSKNILSEDRFSEQFFLFKNLKKLDLSSNKFKFIPNSLPNELTELRLDKNNIFSLTTKPLTLFDYANFYDDEEEQKLLEELKKSNEVKIMHKNVFYSKNLKNFNLSSNNIQDIPQEFGILNHNLVEFDLSDNLIHRFEVSLCRGYVNLTRLNLASNRINSLPEQIRELVKLEYLNLSNNRLNRITYELCNELHNLIELDLNRNSLDEFPLFVFKRNNQLYTTSTSNRIFSSNETRDLVSTNSFTFNLGKLEVLNLAANSLNGALSFHKTFGLCKNLKTINLAANQLEQIEINDNDYQSDYENKDFILSKLNSLNLSNNKILLSKGGFVKLLLNLYKLAPNLNYFYYGQANGTKLGELNDNLGDAGSYYFEQDENMKLNKFYNQMINSLKLIDLSNNNLTKIPNFLYSMKSLKKIILNGNQIEKIPTELVNNKKLNLILPNENDIEEDRDLVDNLEIIELNNNKLEQLPETFFQYFKNLKQIQIFNNPLKEPPKEAICIGFELEDDVVENVKEFWNEYFNGVSKEAREVDPISIDEDSRIKTIKSYMLRFKQREETLLCNMFNIIKDEIKSKETLMKLMRRLKMPMDKVELVCKDIDEIVRNSSQNSKNKKKSKQKRAQSTRELNESILKIQTWKLLNIWRHIYGTDASTDELLRILKLMCSNEIEENILEKVNHIRNVANVLKI